MALNPLDHRCNRLRGGFGSGASPLTRTTDSDLVSCESTNSTDSHTGDSHNIDLTLWCFL
jgi:hypothetical protein